MLTLFLLLAAGQDPDPPAPGACPLPDAPVIEITAQVRMDSVRVVQAGDAEARIWTEPGGEGEWRLDRGALPDPIPVGKTFDDVELSLHARADLTEEGLAFQADAGGLAGTCN